MYSIPTVVLIDDKLYNIRNKGDYRTILDCISCLEDAELDKTERILSALIIFYADFSDPLELITDSNLERLIHDMFVFFNCGSENDRETQHQRKLMDWEQDAQMICSAINKVANTEVRAVEYMHWWTFMGYYMSIGESLYSTVIQIRDKMIRGKKLEKHETEFRTRNPQYFTWNSKTVEQQEAENWVKDVWGSGE